MLTDYGRDRNRFAKMTKKQLLEIIAHRTGYHSDDLKRRTKDSLVTLLMNMKACQGQYDDDGMHQ